MSKKRTFEKTTIAKAKAASRRKKKTTRRQNVNQAAARIVREATHD